MLEVAKVIQSIQNTGSSNEKLSILKNSEHVPGLKEILKFIYNPYCRTGISDKKIEKYWTAQMPIKDVSYTDAIEYFKTHTTGTDADLVFAATFIANQPNECKWLAKAMVTQNLKIGITATSLNKVYGADFIPKTGCMLGTLFSDVGSSKVKWPCIATEKLDGIRRVLIKNHGVTRAFSRSGHEDFGLVEIIAEAAYLPDNCVYDGELLAAGEFKDSIAQRQATSSIANSGGEKTGLIFNVFDMIPLDEYLAGASTHTANVRKLTLGATFNDESIQLLDDRWAVIIKAFCIEQELKFIKPVPILGVVNNLDEVEPIVAKIWARGGEGVMLNTYTGLYEVKRSKQLLKIKHTEEHVLTVTGMIEGTGKFESMLGALIVDYKGTKLGVGSGFTDSQRKHIWDNQDLHIGRKVEIETFGESTNALGTVSLNCPIFKRFVGEEE